METIDILNKIDLSNNHDNSHIYIVQVFSTSLNDFVPWTGMQCDSLDKLETKIIKAIMAVCPGREYDAVIEVYNSLVKKEEIIIYDVDTRMLTIDRVEVESVML